MSATAYMTAGERVVARAAVQRAIEEDLGPERIDLTAACLPERTVGGVVVARSGGVVCGLEVAAMVCEEIGGDAISFEQVAHEGARLQAGDVVATVYGPVTVLLTAERTLLNFLQQMSGVATLTRSFVDAVAGTGARILDTRKTTPGLRALERFAVRCGGGRNHRFGLFDEAMVKDNHIDASGGITPAVERLRARWPHVRVIIETRTLDEVREALTCRPDVVLLDNMSNALLQQAVRVVGGSCETEASGGVTLETVAAVARTGVDRISIGALTHSAPAIDIAFDVQPPGPGRT